MRWLAGKIAFKFAISKGYCCIGKVVESKPIKKYEQVFGMGVFYFQKVVTFTEKVKLNAKQLTLKGEGGFMAC